MTDLHFQPLPTLPGWLGSHLESVGSTNQLMSNHFAARGKAADRHWLTAGEQKAGRGRRERSWVSPPGNLYASLCLAVDQLSSESLAVLPLAFGVAIQRAAAGLVSSSVRLKWPNDVLINGAKCCGMLMQLERSDGASGLIVGIGLNVASNPTDTPYPATHLRAHGFEGDLNSVFSALAHEVANILDASLDVDFVSKTRAAWLACAKGVGDPITVRLANATYEGIFEGLDSEGLLLLRLADKTLKPISAGDVFFA